MLKVGQSAQIARGYSEEDISAFSALSGGKSHGVPEPLISALFSYLLGVELPGSGTNYLKQDLQFKKVAPLNTLLTAKVTITELRREKHLVDLWAICTAPDGTVICEGRSLVKAKDVPGAFCTPS
ncbi:phosphate acetyltransferase [Falsiruegeria mediterranea]|jgi:acyl dehydratase|uniref:(R)-specific enoyl-CoA hydratase n=1 Tax=Falsiruegeria mediterranea M17 TaxID=1200281 RepID=A0A2R8CDE3_9RHOB|nr:phosphate acetyltransferase [Falsiruegeria mediterranea]SPJ30480.1 (R)-specific enoyl-CoA hydratase [Falsiruegeria mediterranea M17]